MPDQVRHDECNDYYGPTNKSEQLAYLLFHSADVHVTARSVDLLAFLEEEQGRQTHHFQFHAESPVLRHLNFCQLNPSRVFGVKCLNLRQKLNARASLRPPKIDHYRYFRSEYFCIERFFRYFNHSHSPY